MTTKEQMADEVMYLAGFAHGKGRTVTTEATNRILSIIRADPHEPDTRPCETCRRVTAILGEPFWCLRRALAGDKPETVDKKPANVGRAVAGRLAQASVLLDVLRELESTVKGLAGTDGTWTVRLFGDQRPVDLGHGEYGPGPVPHLPPKSYRVEIEIHTPG